MSPSKVKNLYVCSNCAYETPKWCGKCPECGQWNTMNEEVKTISKNKNSIGKISYEKPLFLKEINTTDEERYKTGSKELDRVLGGGIVKGSLILLGGDPGIGKSTMLMQVCNNVAKDNTVFYVSGEESKKQLKLRADRLNVCSDNILVYTQTDVEIICELIKNEKPDLVIIDSIQTMTISEISSSPGSVTQVRESTNLIMRTAKHLDISVIVIGHVNKDGAIAGPKVLEHIVDAVLYFEGDKQMSYKILRAVKNRYGSTNEIGVFQMSDKGLSEVANPSLMLLSGRPKNVSGTCVACTMEGTRPLLAEVQGLATTTGFGNPRRMSTGFDYNRMSLILAVLEKRAGYYFSNVDAYINIVGGLRLDEPAVDLAVAMSLVSSLKDIPIPDDILVFGEIGLAGEIRSVSHAQARIVEAYRLGFKRCILPQQNIKGISDSVKSKITLIGVTNIREAFKAIT